jgi:hypothetical protein
VVVLAALYIAAVVVELAEIAARVTFCGLPLLYWTLYTLFFRRRKITRSRAENR